MLGRVAAGIASGLLCLCLAQAAFFQGAIYNPASIIPASRQTVWQPGVTYNAIPASSSVAGNTVPSIVGAGYGYPARTQCGSTLSPIGGGSDDTAQINSALGSCTSGHYVLLNCGVYNINSGGVIMHASGITIRGCGPGKGLSTGINAVNTSPGSATFTTDATATQLVKQDRASNTGAIIYMGEDSQQFSGSTLLAANAVQGAYSVAVTSTSGLSVGQIVIVDHNTDNDPNMFFNVNDDPPGAECVASISGTVLTVTSCSIGSIIAGTCTNNNVPSCFGMQVAWGALYGGNTGNSINLDSYGTGSGGAGTYNLHNTVIGNQSSQLMGIGHGTKRDYTRQDRTVSQMMEIASIAGSTVTFTTPFHYTFLTSFNAQLTQYTGPLLSGIGVENMMVFGGTGRNISIGLLAYSWVKSVEMAYGSNGNLALWGCFRCEVRDSYVHECSNPNPGGGCYIIDLATGTSDTLLENNISWYGDKILTMRGTGGGNVFAYNYTDDAFGSTFPNSPESGVNAGHATTPNMELLEGNYSFQAAADSFHGSSINITYFRNQLSMLRGAWPPLNTYTSGSLHYQDNGNRVGMAIQAGSYFNNFVGNVIGWTASADPHQSATSIAWGGGANFSLLSTETSFAFDNLTTFPAANVVPIWAIGEQQEGGSGNIWVSTTYQTLLRQGNWDWFTQTQTWLGIGGTQGSPLGTPQTIPNSLYTTSIGGGAPAFFSSSMYCPCTWPWVNPATGAVTTLPAKARFDNGTTNGFNTLHHIELTEPANDNDPAQDIARALNAA